MGVTVAAKGYKGHQTTVCNPNPIVYSQVHVVLGVLPKTEVIWYFKLVFSILLMHALSVAVGTQTAEKKDVVSWVPGTCLSLRQLLVFGVTGLRQGFYV